MNEDYGCVLVVDDDPQALALLVNVLGAEGYHVQPADGGKLALLSVAAQPPDLILLDVKMPGMDGFEVCRQLKRTEAGRGVPVMFVSASCEKKEWVEGLSLGAVDFVSKPFQREELVARVRAHVEWGRLRSHLETLVVQRTVELESAIEQLRLEVSERRRAEQSLRESEQRFRQIANAAPVIIWTSDRDNRTDFRNEYAQAFTGRSITEMSGNHWAELIHPEDLVRQQQGYALNSATIFKWNTGCGGPMANIGGCWKRERPVFSPMATSRATSGSYSTLPTSSAARSGRCGRRTWRICGCYRRGSRTISIPSWARSSGKSTWLCRTCLRTLRDARTWRESSPWRSAPPTSCACFWPMSATGRTTARRSLST
ncbi:hypothetical protein SBA3_1640017 [Candidatus Sulfopaludibacter sp. SbA3]|nr:hypothetical protein SBA3_1640017 [Candidatus Sulfopaludibacter sp. SbA3]